jgi:hypothetical protein
LAGPPRVHDARRDSGYPERNRARKPVKSPIMPSLERGPVALPRPRVRARCEPGRRVHHRGIETRKKLRCISSVPLW